ncbi:MAG: hypothetical protein SH807_03805 [Blastochloris sp.]|nr:hypothetical protein [Blastochloris sp.]
MPYFRKTCQRPRRRINYTHERDHLFEVREDEVDGGYNAMALGYGIHTEGESIKELRTMVKEAVDCYFDGTMEAPHIIRLHFVRDEILAR